MTDFSIHLPGFAGRATFRATAVEVWSGMSAMLRARSSRRVLAQLDDRMLADIGVGRGEASTEAARPMWDLAARRR